MDRTIVVESPRTVAVSGTRDDDDDATRQPQQTQPQLQQAPPPRRSSRRRSQRAAATASGANASAAVPTIRGLPITAFRRPWTQHYIDIGHCRLGKCTKRIQQASDKDIQNLSISFLAMAIKASTAYGPKWRQEQALLDYTNAVMARGIAPNDHDDTTHNGGGRLGSSAISMAAYFGYPRLLKLLLDAGCPIGDGSRGLHALLAAVKNTQHECLRLLLKERPQEIRNQLHKESLASWVVTQPTTLKVAMTAGDVEAVRLLHQEGNAKVLILFKNNNKKKWTTILKEIYSDQPTTNDNVNHWSPKLHWSFSGVDRRMLNWLWYALQKQQQRLEEGNNQSRGEAGVGATAPNKVVILPSEIWLRVFGFVGRGWWSLSTLSDQNGMQFLSPSMI